MARFYYDRYRVNSSTLYNWSKYEVIATPTAYAEGDWGAEIVQGYYPYDYPQEGRLNDYSFNSSTGKFSAPKNRDYLEKVTSQDIQYLYYTSDQDRTLNRVFYSVVKSDYNVYKQTKTSYITSSNYSQGTYISSTNAAYSYKINNAANSDGFWWVRGVGNTTYSRGTYIDTVIAEDGTYPNDGRVGTSYWYIKKGAKSFRLYRLKLMGFCENLSTVGR